jgi:hypothetical protein
MSSHRALFQLAVASLAVIPVGAQSVVSIHAGVVNCFEGSVAIDGQPLEQKFGKFYDIRPGSVLSTDAGRAEVVLTPGVLFRVDQDSSIRMMSNKLTDARIEFIGGSAALDNTQASAKSPVTIVYKGYEVRFRQPGRYRFNSGPAELRVEQGEADVLALDGKSVDVGTSQVLTFSSTLAVRSVDQPLRDGLDRWIRERSQVLSADNASAAASDDMSAALDNPPDNPYDPGAYPSLSSAAGSGIALGGGGSGSPFGLGPYGNSPYGYGYSPYGYGYSPYGFGVPYGIFGMPMLYNNIPLYRRYTGVTTTYRPLYPVRTGIGVSVAPPAWRSPGRVTSTPTYRPISPAAIPHAAGHVSAGHVGGHR